MPNHCSNLVNVTGPRLLVAHFLKKAKGEKQPLSFQSLVPMPEDLKDTNGMGDETTPEALALIVKYGAADWYGWNIANWSTKWDCYETGHEWNMGYATGNKPVTADLQYQTAWCPASKFWQAVSKLFPNLEFTHFFSEPGMCFVGFEKYCKGELVAKADYEWDSDAGKSLRSDFGHSDEDLSGE
jgi:hypothetical protein